MKIKAFVLVFFLIVISGCSNSNTISPENPESTASYIDEILNLNSDISFEPTETYLGIRDTYKIGDDVIIYLDNDSKNIDRIYFLSLSETQARSLFDEIEFPITDNYEEILQTKADEIELTSKILYMNNYEDVGVRLDVREVDEYTYRTHDRPYYMNILYNDEIFDDFKGLFLP